MPLVVEELCERVLRCGAVQPDECTNEVAEVAGPFAGELERGLVPDAGGDQDPLELCEVLGG